MNAVERALVSHRAFVRTAAESGIKQANNPLGDLGIGGGDVGLGSLFSSGGKERNYQQYRGWLYAAVHALAREAAGQPACVGRINGEAVEERRAVPTQNKHAILKKMPQQFRTKMAAQQWEVLYDHPMLDVLEKPNPVQGRWQFVYSFVANLNLTGAAYIVGGEDQDGRMSLYSLPTSWVVPIHKDGPNSAFRILEPGKSGGGIVLGPENVAFAYLPNPSSLLGALAPATSQANAIKVDEHIQTSQERFFLNGVFPSVIVTIGKNVDATGGTRPVLTGTQRRQIIGAIRKQMASVENYGNPAIVDGLIEKIDRLSATSNEMGWDKSEDKIRTRILSAFGVHPFILGEPMAVGGYAQASIIHERFCKQVNTFLDMLSSTVSQFVADNSDERSRVVVWWEQCEPHDPQLRQQALKAARDKGDITKNEMRAELGFPPDETETDTSRVPLLDTVGGMQGYATIATAVSQGAMSVEAGANALALFFQIPADDARKLLGADNDNAATPLAIPDESPESIGELADATRALESAVAVLGMTPAAIARVLGNAAKT